MTDTSKMRMLIERTLKGDERLWTKTETPDKSELNQTKLLDLIESTDKHVITLLFNELSLRAKFFIKIADSHVFKINDFRFFMEQNKLNNSYTDYKNRIGLSDGRRFIKDTKDVVLNFPFKDDILQGGQSREDGEDTYFEYDHEVTKKEQKKGYKANTYNEKTDKRKEIFFNQVLAQDEIDRLLDPKALVHWKRYTKKGTEQAKALKRDQDDMLKENLIIKGNNLLALHSLKEQFASKVKLIYIDPPYNTGNDGFKYNDNFNHSTWLVFMKNRLEVARHLLRDDGVIFVQCDDNEQAYLKVLMDEVFGRGNLNSVISAKVSSESGVKVNANKPVRVKEYLLIYSKTGSFIYNRQFVKNQKYDSNYSYYVKNRTDLPKNWEIINIKDAFKEIENKEINLVNLYKFQLKNKNKIFSVRDININLKQKFKDSPNQFFVIKKENKTTILWKKGEIIFFENKVNLIDGIECGTKYLSDIWTDISWDGIAEEGGVKLKNSKKPEQLIQRMIDMSTQPGDIVLDYHLGSGTTAAVAHKMGRQYIGIEQMDYIESIAVERLKKVISGEQSGISKAVEWQGGGEFVYCELAEWNEQAKRKIKDCKNLADLEKLFNTLYEKYFLNYNLKTKEFKEKVLKESKFHELSLPEHQKIFATMLDNNQMYINKSEMADKKYKIAGNDQSLAEKFYSFALLENE